VETGNLVVVNQRRLARNHVARPGSTGITLQFDLGCNIEAAACDVQGINAAQPAAGESSIQSDLAQAKSG